MWKRIWNKAEKRAGFGGLAGSMTMMNEWFFPPSSGRRWREAPEVGSCTLLAEQNQWISPVGTFSEWSWDRAMRQKSMQSLYLLHGTRQGEHLWFSPPWCFLTCPLCRSFPSTYHSFFSSLFFLEKHHIDVMQASIWCFFICFVWNQCLYFIAYSF